MKKGRRLIIGYGNPLRGDDGLGWEVAGRLAANIADQSVEIRTVHQLTPDLIEPISQAELVIFVDASREGSLGKWECRDLTSASDAPAVIEHQMDAETLLGYAAVLFHAHPRALLISVTAESFECCEYLSRTVELVIPQVVKYIRETVTAPSGATA